MKNAPDFVEIGNKKVDACLHIPMLDNPDAEGFSSRLAKREAIAGGMAAELADRLYSGAFDIKTVE
jgi:hypothetical protein